MVEVTHMKGFTFRAWCRSGKFCTGDSHVWVELTDEEAERIIKFAANAEILYDADFCEIDELADIYDKVHAIAVKQITEEMRDWGGEDEEETEKMRDPNWSAEDWYSIRVGFPLEIKQK